MYHLSLHQDYIKRCQVKDIKDFYITQSNITHMYYCIFAYIKCHIKGKRTVTYLLSTITPYVIISYITWAVQGLGWATASDMGVTQGLLCTNEVKVKLTNWTQWLGTHFTKVLWAHNWNLVKIITTLIMILMIQSGYKFAHVTTAQLLWHVQNCDLI